MENRILLHLGQRDGYRMVMEAGTNGRTYYALYIGVALLDCYPVDDDEAEEWVQRKMLDYKLAQEEADV
ncbi:MAG: hypothetical protein J6S81_02210 [Treponema sp.]|nr:hypothetical protein [Treponema sp.]